MGSLRFLGLGLVSVLASLAWRSADACSIGPPEAHTLDPAEQGVDTTREEGPRVPPS